MSLFPKLEVAIDQGIVLIGEAITLVRLANRVLADLGPTIAELPAVARGARRVLDGLEAPPKGSVTGAG